MTKQLPNIVLITADSLRADYCGFINKELHLTPFIDKIAREGILLKKAYSNAPYTALSIPSIMTGKYPIFLQTPLVGSRITISEYLRKKGYITIGAISSNPPAKYFSGNGRGFVIFKEINGDKNESALGRSSGRRANLREGIYKIREKIFRKSPTGVYRDCESLMVYVLEKIVNGEISSRAYYPKLDLRTIRFAVNAIKITKSRSKRRPFFLWLHLMATHYPYAVPLQQENPSLQEFIKYQRRKAILLALLWRYVKESEEYKKILFNAYREGVKTLDIILKQFFENLEEEDLTSETIIIFTSDHGEELFEHGDYGHWSKLNDVNLRIPMFLWGMEEKTEINIPITNADIFPTIIELVNSRMDKLSSRLLDLLEGTSILKLITSGQLLEEGGSRIVLSETTSGVNFMEMMTGRIRQLPFGHKNLLILVRATDWEDNYVIVSAKKDDSVELKDTRGDNSQITLLRKRALERALTILDPEKRDIREDVIYKTLRKIHVL